MYTCHFPRMDALVEQLGVSGLTLDAAYARRWQLCMPCARHRLAVDSPYHCCSFDTVDGRRCQCSNLRCVLGDDAVKACTFGRITGSASAITFYGPLPQDCRPRPVIRCSVRVYTWLLSFMDDTGPWPMWHLRGSMSDHDLRYMDVLLEHMDRRTTRDQAWIMAVFVIAFQRANRRHALRSSVPSDPTLSTTLLAMQSEDRIYLFPTPSPRPLNARAFAQSKYALAHIDSLPPKRVRKRRWDQP